MIGIMISQLAFTVKGKSKTTDQVCTFLYFLLCRREAGYTWLLLGSPQSWGQAPLPSAGQENTDTRVAQTVLCWNNLCAGVCTKLTYGPERTILVFLFPSTFLMHIKEGCLRLVEGLGELRNHLSAAERQNNGDT